MVMNRAGVCLALALLLAACASPRPAPPPPVWAPAPAKPAPAPEPVSPPVAMPQPVRPAGTPVAPAPVASTVLKAEYDWLHQLFGPTPVRLAMGNDGSITLRVPMQHAFDAGAVEAKPALQAVLAKLAESMARQPQATLLTQVPGAAPRALAVRDVLATHGVPPGRISSSSAPSDGAEVVLRLVP